MTQLVAVSVVLVLAAGIFVGFYGLQPKHTNHLQTGAPLDSSTNNEPASASALNTTTGTALNATNGTSAQSPMGLNPASWDGFEEMKVTADDYMQQYLVGAYSVSGWVLTYIDPESCCVPGTMQENVTGVQTVTGSWDGGYNITYTGIKTLVVEFLPADFSVITASMNPLPDRNETVSFTAQEKQVIGFVVSNKAVQGKVDLGKYYVGRFTQMPLDSANQTYAGDYLVYLNQIDGPAYSMVLVNPGATDILGMWP
jgi:hypothetical protein